MEKSKKKLLVSMGLIAAFVGWTIAVQSINVEPIGPQGSQVGFAALNRFVHQLTGVHFWLYTITDWLGLIPVGVCASFGILGLAQWIRRKKLSKVDWDLLALGVFYLIVISAYLFFEAVVINNRPVLIEGVLEASYPSSTTMLILCVMPTAVM